MQQIIKKKRDGKALTQQEIQHVIDGLISEEIPDYQISAFLMAIYFRGMNDEETTWLTDAVLKSGEQIDLSSIEGAKVDKHSTGGVGDKTTLILAPLVAAAGVPVAKMSGRGLGHTGGTIDKLESFPGFSVDMSKEQFIERIRKHNIAICGQNAKLVPADKKLYALRDVTATVDNHSLITSSIMGKKLACGADAIVIDMKVGKGAYMDSIDEAEKLAEAMITIGQKMDRKVVVVISAMDQPLGYTVGNALEVREAIDTLKGGGSAELKELCLSLGAEMLKLAEHVTSIEEGRKLLQSLIDDGSGLKKFKELIAAQGGDVSMLDKPELLPVSSYSRSYKARKAGYITEMHAMKIGRASVCLGAGRENKQSKIDLGAGILLRHKVGDQVVEGDTLAVLYSDSESSFDAAEQHLHEAYHISDTAPKMQPIVLKTMR